MWQKLSALLLVCFLPFSLLSAQDISPEKSKAIVEQVDLAQVIVSRLVESLNLRENSLLQNEQNLQQKEQLLNEKETSLAKKEQNLIDRESLQRQTEEVLKSYQTSLKTSEFWHKIKNSVIITLAIACVVEGIIVAVK